MPELMNTIMADGPSTNPNQPVKHQMRVWGTWVESIINAFTSNGGLIFSTKAAMDANLNFPAGQMTWVMGDPVVANNGIYQKFDASGAGSWVRRGDLPYSFIRLSDAGAGTANAIQATSLIPLPAASSAALLVMNVFEGNTGHVTLAINGAAPKPIVGNSGSPLSPGDLRAGMGLLILDDGASFRIMNDFNLQIVSVNDTGAGTANAIQATSTTPFSTGAYDAILLLNVFEANTDAATLSINGGATRPIVTNSGGALSSGYLVAGMVAPVVFDGTNYRLLSDVASTAIQAAAEAAADRAENAADSAADYAALARNDFAVNRFAGNYSIAAFTLSADPGSANNCLVYIDGVYQQKDTYTLSGTTITFSEAPPGDGVADNIEVAFGYRVAVGTPADGSITNPKLGLLAVATGNMQDGSATKAKLASSAVDETKIDGTRKPQIRAAIEISFSANKGAVDQTGVVTGVFTKLVFPSEDWDIGGYYDAPTSKWTPPAGRYALNLTVLMNATNVLDQTAYIAAIYKNGSLHKSTITKVSGAAAQLSACVDALVTTDGTDYFEAYIYGDGGGNQVINGQLTFTYFQGRGI